MLDYLRVLLVVRNCIENRAMQFCWSNSMERSALFRKQFNLGFIWKHNDKHNIISQFVCKSSVVVVVVNVILSS